MASDVSLSLLRRTTWKVKVIGRVALRDASGAAVPGATVTASWLVPGRPARTVSATSDASGTASFVTAGGLGTYTLTVSAVAAGSLTFDAAGSVLVGSLTVP